ncbi:MAG: hypothetical protein ALECFALPRED_003765 [Alectoria fallacina]|uniref:Uncharacterized protein n=1 Tax=Alectoria fallacina TaxID=1903189 RepID=A0A8H3ERQ0_9LECA|nr:MAG: hypothetical protein ALECFALPRED_003765 [Alectoria fallacina]
MSSVTCPYEDAIFRAGDFILSLEKAERCDPSRSPLSYKAVACLSEVLNSAWNHKKGKRGLGEHGEERWHLTCFESLCREVRKRELLLNPGDDIPSWAPSMEFGHHIITDERRIPAYPGKFNIESPYQFGLELWKATQLFDDRQAHGAHFMPSVPPHVQLPDKLIDGADGQSLYLTPAAKSFRGKMPWGETAEISAAMVRGITLDEMTRRVSAMMKPKYQARRELKKQEELAKKARNELEATATSPNEEDVSACHVMEAVSKPMNGSAIPETASVKSAGTSKHDVAERSDRAIDVSSANEPTPPASLQSDLAQTQPGRHHNRGHFPPRADSRSTRNPPPGKPKPQRAGRRNSALQAAATVPEKEAPDGDAGIASEDGEDDVVFLGRSLIAKGGEGA